MNVTRILAGASIVGVTLLPASWLATGVAAAKHGAPGVVVPAEPLPADQAANDDQRDQAPPPPAGDAGFSLPQGLADQVNQAAANLPSPVQLNVPVNVGLPGIGLPGIGLTVPLAIGGLALPSLPGVGLPEIGPPQLPQLPSVGLPQLPF